MAGREGVLEVTSPEQCVEGWVGIVQEKSVATEAQSGPKRGDSSCEDKESGPPCGPWALLAV